MEFEIFFFCIQKDNIMGNDQTNINSIASHSITVFMILFEMTHPRRYGPAVNVATWFGQNARRNIL